MDDSPFTKLPPELRNRIYELALTVPDTLYFTHCPERDTWLFVQAKANENLLAISQTCKALHGECRGMFFALNSFQINIAPMPIPLGITSFLNRIGPSNATSLRSVVVDIGGFCLKRISMSRAQSPIEGISERLSVHIPHAIAALKGMAEEYGNCHFKLTCNLTPFDLMPIQLLVSDYALEWDALLQQVQHIRTVEKGKWSGLDWLVFMEYFATRKLGISRQQVEESLGISVSQKKAFADLYHEEVP